MTKHNYAEMNRYLRKLILLLGGGVILTMILIHVPSATVGPKENAAHARPRPSKQRHAKIATAAAHFTNDLDDSMHLDRHSVLAGRQKLDLSQPSLPPKQIDIGPHSSAQLSRQYVPFVRDLDESLLVLGRYVEQFESDPQPSECAFNTTLEQYWKEKDGKTAPKADSWDRFYAQIGTCQLYSDDAVIADLLHDLNTLPIKRVVNMESGTQIKLVITFTNGKKAVFKPMRFGRDYETDKNHFYFTDFERHTAEIATFHLDRVLGFRRAVPTVGRVVNIETELKVHAEKKLAKTFFWSPAGNRCFVGKCDYYCDTTHAICGAPDLKEGSLQVFLPNDKLVPRAHKRSPYRRTYSKKNQLSVWQQDDTFCDWKVKNLTETAHGRRLVDLVDVYIMDFLIGNQDRHHFEAFTVFTDTVTYPIHLDNGRAFGRTDIDDIDILKPLTQCCLIRPSTLKTLLGYYSGPISLTQALHRSMSDDPVAPILAQKHYPSMERRLEIVLREVKHCIDKTDWRSVLRNTYENPNYKEGRTSKELEKEHNKEPQSGDIEDEETTTE